MYSLLPIYRKNSLKHFQLKGNYFQWKFGLITGTKEFVLPFFTNEKLTSGGVITSFLAYKLDDKQLYQCNTRARLTTNRIKTITLPTANILQAADGRYYCLGNQILTTYLEPGIYELYFTDGTNEFESEIFEVCSNIFGTISDPIEPPIEPPSGALSFKWDTTMITFDNSVITFDKV